MRRSFSLVCAVVACSLGFERTARADDLTMETAVRMALERNRSVIAARLEIEGAQIDRIAAGIYWNPVFTYSMGNLVIPPGNTNNMPPPSGPFSQTVQNFGISEVIDVWFKRSARIDAANAGIEWHKLRVEDALRDIVYAVRGSFLDLVREQEESELARTMNARYAETVRLARARVAAGEISPSEGGKIELESLKYQNALIDAEMELDLARDRLARLMGLPSRNDLPGKAVIASSTRVPPALQPLVQKALENRPDLRAARKGRSWADAMLTSSKREGFPDIAVGAGYTHSEFTASGDNSNSLGFFISFPIPLFDRNQPGIARAHLEQTRADNETARITIEVEHDVAEAVRRLERSDALLDIYEDGGMLTRADNALAVAEKSYKAGAISLLELLEAQRTYIDTRTQYLKAQDDWRQANAEVLHATGER